MSLSNTSNDADGAQKEIRMDEDYGLGYVDEGNAVHRQAFVSGESWYAKIQRFAGKYGVEQRGIERVPNDERTDAGMSQIGTLVRSNHSSVLT